MEKQDELGSFSDYLGPQNLKADMISDLNQVFVVINLKKEKYDDQETPVLQLILESNETEYRFSLNKTNLMIIDEKGISEPKELLGKKLWFGKRKVTNPTNGKLQDSLYIDKIE